MEGKDISKEMRQSATLSAETSLGNPKQSALNMGKDISLNHIKLLN